MCVVRSVASVGCVGCGVFRLVKTVEHIFYLRWSFVSGYFDQKLCRSLLAALRPWQDADRLLSATTPPNHSTHPLSQKSMLRLCRGMALSLVRDLTAAVVPQQHSRFGFCNEIMLALPCVDG